MKLFVLLVTLFLSMNVLATSLTPLSKDDSNKILSQINGIFTVDTFSFDRLPEYSQHFSDKRNPFDDARAAISLAQKTNRNIVIEIGGTWCAWCTKMDIFLAENIHVATAFHNSFVLLKVSVSDSNENTDFMKGLPPVLGYPHMYVTTDTAKMLLSKDTAELVENGVYSEQKWLAFVEQWQKKSELPSAVTISQNRLKEGE